ncbi:maleylpyruvate isomerase N-terminal domain-containing protein [Actinotalea sp. Marseille-Q4924]|uniref:maleylpyruvate isomerase N-terminal domain-containing protein n=1 Tax=Actinotalea sp. Marseille-Q4924 TaxID=2866571 RepID=UPI001CE42CAB|nr:maleylpyruvate isomerase N-terminal domain-containing protein [Actinotalea sp. Marseille-Q4924]
MEYDTYVLAVREETERFLDALGTTDADAPVPTCDWTAADLLWHVAEVQHHWAAVVRGAHGEAVVAPDRPEDLDALRTLAATAGTELAGALAEAAPDDAAWSWHEDGGTVAWVARRQAHEAVVHRVDAELTAGRAVTPPTVELAADGVDEVLHVMLDGVPDWGTFTPDGVTVRLECTNVDASWLLRLGRFTGTGPESGTPYDLDAAAVQRDVAAHGADVTGAARDDVDLLVRAPAWELDMWLWGRGPADGFDVSGPGGAALLERVRQLMVEATQ